MMFTKQKQYSIKVFTYKLPKNFKSKNELLLPTETFNFIDKFFRKTVATKDPIEADYYYVPINLIQFQFRREDPIRIVNYLEYLTDKKNHIIIALGDFSQRSRLNHFGEAYPKLYPWLGRFNLLALESTSDLIQNRDIGIMPVNTLTKKPYFNTNYRPLLYSFLGETKHIFLPKNHVRTRLGKMKFNNKDVFIGNNMSDLQIKSLKKNFKCKDVYELVSRNSIFTLCPAGYGRWTYRFFQAINWGSIPVLISDDYIKPFDRYIPYDDFSITVKEKDLESVDELLRKFSKVEIGKYQESLRINQKYFTHDRYKELLANELTRIKGYI